MMERMSVLLIFVFPLDSLTWILIISLMDLECFVYLWHRSKCHVQSIGVILMIAFDLRIFHSSTSDHFLSLSQHMLHLIPFQSWHDQRMTILFIPLFNNWMWIGDELEMEWINGEYHASITIQDWWIWWSCDVKKGIVISWESTWRQLFTPTLTLTSTFHFQFHWCIDARSDENDCAAR